MADQPARLARIAAARPPQVRIYQLDKAYTQWVWLCPKHLELRKQMGYDVKADIDPPHELTCDDRNRGSCS